ncbi:MAG: fluoride efflux transporter CrcB [Devosia sp.]|jgi:CrcB protein|uniref:fluoride efflux transporter CrcB n=1 Tax=unclassified Devosia TaxID=196773 RepID=UPI0019D9DEE7|nr:MULTISPECIES: fluoride efflux transporter CrcB [unclassified Devosia]MBF0678561.1 fluoride efflux transporter CrcB [Devosia sp.]WEJ31869.1 fluoride efflux transporter CrcB [Devosia sp. SD17-2]
MASVLLVGAGGAIGAMARYGFGLLFSRHFATTFPLATLLINILGSLAMGLVIGLLSRFMPPWQEAARLFLAVGVLGGFTTFSAFSLDAITLLERGELANALFYVALSVVVCLAGLYLGLLISKGGAA